MKISIAMASYNGARFLPEQLNSFLNQTRLPDEVIVTDDGSTDDTMKILEEFANKAPFEVRIYRNEHNLGYARNFDRALSFCTGDLVFLSDQDDIWFKEKIERMVIAANKHVNAMLLMNDAELVLADGSPLGLTKLKQTLSLGLPDTAFTTGCCMALRRQFLDIALPVPSKCFVHDTWFNRLSLALDAKVIVSEVLQYYRRHGNNTSNWLASRTVRQKRLDLIRAYKSQDPRPHALKRLEQLKVLKQRLETYFLDSDILESIYRLERERMAIITRLAFLDMPWWHRLWKASEFYLQGNYRFFSGWKSYLKDIIFNVSGDRPDGD